MADTGQNSQAPVVVVGLGPAGLTAALELAKKGIDVLAITNRDFEDYTRVQRVKLDSSTVAYMIRQANLFTDRQDRLFINKLLRQRGTIQIGEIEQFLYRQLTQYRGINLTVVGPVSKIERKLEPAGKDIEDDVDMRGQLSAVDNNAYKIEITLANDDKENIPYQHIIAADGVRRGVHRMVTGEQDVEEALIPGQKPRHEFHGTTTLALNSTARKSLKKTGKPAIITADKVLKVGDLQDLKNFGWKKDFLPRVYIITDASRRSYYVAGEIPESMFIKSDDPNDMIKQKIKQQQQWSKLIIEKSLGIKSQDLHVEKPSPEKFRQAHGILRKKARAVADKVERLSTTQFPMSYKKLKEPVQDLSGTPGEHVLNNVGDTVLNPVYTFAHGVNDAMRMAITAAQAIDPKTGKYDIKRSQQLNAHLEQTLEKRIEQQKKADEIHKEQLQKDIDKSFDAFMKIIVDMEKHAKELKGVGQDDQKLIDGFIMDLRNEVKIFKGSKGYYNHTATAQFIENIESHYTKAEPVITKYRGSKFSKAAGRFKEAVVSLLTLQLPNRYKAYQEQKSRQVLSQTNKARLFKGTKTARKASKARKAAEKLAKISSKPVRQGPKR